jgi:hypothetical protein
MIGGARKDPMSRARLTTLALLILAVVILITSFMDVSRSFRLLLAAILFIIFLLQWMDRPRAGE